MIIKLNKPQAKLLMATLAHARLDDLSDKAIQSLIKHLQNEIQTEINGGGVAGHGGYIATTTAARAAARGVHGGAGRAGQEDVQEAAGAAPGEEHLEPAPCGGDERGAVVAYDELSQLADDGLREGGSLLRDSAARAEAVARGAIYLSGPISGSETLAQLRFMVARRNVERRYGCEVVNPMELPHRHDGQWESYMREDIAAMMGCAAIYMMDGWQRSRGARIERDIAHQVGMVVIYETPIK